MSCPSWRALAAHREGPLARPRDDEPAGWREALEHFDGGCPRCRREALAADPSLVFRRLPRLEMSAAQEAAEVNAVLQAVTAMRTVSRMDSFGRRSHTGGWKRWAAAAVLVGASLSIPADNAWRSVDEVEDLSTAAFAAPGDFEPVLPAAYSGDSGLPTIEGVNRPGARVYHMDAGDVSLTMIFDKSLDV